MTLSFSRWELSPFSFKTKTFELNIFNSSLIHAAIKKKIRSLWTEWIVISYPLCLSKTWSYKIFDIFWNCHQSSLGWGRIIPCLCSCTKQSKHIWSLSPAYITLTFSFIILLWLKMLGLSGDWYKTTRSPHGISNVSD